MEVALNFKTSQYSKRSQLKRTNISSHGIGPRSRIARILSERESVSDVQL